jgi:hypothetical protein
MAMKKTPSRKPATKKTTKKSPARKKTNRETLEKAGVINQGYEFSPQDSAAIETLSNQEVNVLINVYKNLGKKMLEKNCPHGIVF